MNELKILNNKTIEEAVDFIIEKYHEPLPELIDELNEKGRKFFYNSDNFEDLKELREMFFQCTSDIFTHIDDEEEEQFPLLLNKMKTPDIEVNMEIIGRITEEHNVFDNIFFELEKRLNAINIEKSDLNYNDYKGMIDSFAIFHRETIAHIKIERELLEDFLYIMKEKGIEIKF